MYKKVYVEITNNCNLSCSFCSKSKRVHKNITIEEFKIILAKLKCYTNYLYFHVLGEPLIHPDINELINLASKSFNVNITTNGYLIDRIKDNKNIRQINISLHSYNDSSKISLSEYLENIFKSVDKLKDSTYISYRIWTKSKYTKDIIDKINKRYNSNIDYLNIKNNSTITNNIFISTHDEFTWPNINNDSENKIGTCYALKNHIGILVDGTVIPCCLDAEGIINLGNIYEDEIDTIINSKRYQDMLEGFKKKEKIEELCQKCNFIKEKNE